MKKTTQCAIKEENDILIKNKLFCEISKYDFSLEIKNIEKPLDFGLNKEEIFFQYSINFANIIKTQDRLYSKAFTDKENKIINNINSISKDITSKYENKLIIYSMSVMFIFAVCSIFCNNKSKMIEIINLIITFLMFYLIQYYFLLQMNKDEIKTVSSLNEKYIKDGYYIYINSNIISIFYLKEEHRINGDIHQMKEMNENLMKKMC